MKRTSKVALAGLVCALSLVCMLLTVIPVMEISLPVLAGILLVVLVVELGWKWGVLGYFTVAILSMLLAPSFESRILFAVFFGYYPVLKSLIERFRAATACWAVKLFAFNLAVGGAYFLLMRFTTAVDVEEFTLFGVYLPGVLLLLGNVVFVIYDIALSRLITTYVSRWQPKLRKLLRF